jgi:hypothetical protein
MAAHHNADEDKEYVWHIIVESWTRYVEKEI